MVLLGQRFFCQSLRKTVSYIFSLQRGPKLSKFTRGRFLFRGGHFDDQDKNLEQTALREVREEIGILPNNVEIIGCLDDTKTITGYLITPYIGLIKGERIYKINHHEIERILEAPLDHFLKIKNWQRGQYVNNGKIYEGKYCLYKRDEIWGATAKILRKFIDLVTIQNS